MRNLFINILKESITDLVKYRNEISSLKKPEESLKGNKEDGTTNSDEFFWGLVNLLDYKLDNSYKRIHDLLLELNQFAGLSPEYINTFRKILQFKMKCLDDKLSDDIEGVSDDSWSDVRADIVSRGKDFYNKALHNPRFVQEMIDNDDYTESFSYSIPYKDELI